MVARLYSRSWLPNAEIKALVIVVHGLGEHSGRYTHVGEYLSQQSYAVYALDYSGHGQSPGQRVYVNSLEQLSEDLGAFVEHAQAQHPGLKTFIYGHSMGTLVTLRYALAHQDRLAGLILTGTTLALASLPGLLVPLVQLLNRTLPNLPLLPGVGTSVLSKDPAVVQGYNDDPLVYHGWLRVRILHYLLLESRCLSSQLQNLTLPLLILHGAEDKLLAPAGSHMLYERAASCDKTLKMYAGLRHEIHNEPEQSDVLKDILDWLDNHSLES